MLEYFGSTIITSCILATVGLCRTFWGHGGGREKSKLNQPKLDLQPILYLKEDEKEGIYNILLQNPI